MRICKNLAACRAELSYQAQLELAGVRQPGTQRRCLCRSGRMSTAKLDTRRV